MRPLLEKPKRYTRRRILTRRSELINKLQKNEKMDAGGYPIAEMLLNFAWIGPVRSKPKRTYDNYRVSFSPEGEHTPYLLRELLRNKRSTKDFTIGLRDYGKNSGLFESLLVKDFRNEVATPFEIDAVINGVPLKISNIGYGVSQILPIIVELMARTKRHWFAIQQPEIHLHPKAQAAIGDMLFRLARTEHKRFIIETHSDFMIDRFRLNYKKYQSSSAIQSKLFFFERTKNGNKVSSVRIRENGEYDEKQPKSFRGFFIREEMNLLGIN